MEEQMGLIHKVHALLERSSSKSTATLAACLLFVVMGPTQLVATSLMLVQPAGSGTDVVRLFNKNGTVVATLFVNITADMTPELKAEAVQGAIQRAGYEANLIGGKEGLVLIEQTAAVSDWVFVSNTGELNQAGLAHVGLYAGSLNFGFDGPLSGIGFAGHPASYTAGLGFDIAGSSIFASSIITYASLSNRTLSGLLTLTYDNLDAALPSADRHLLSLNLSTDTITFTPPLGATNVYVQSLSYDTMTGSTVGGSAVTPEPSSAWFALTGAGLIFGIAKFRHRLLNRKAVLELP
jgi:hypothetical protein